MTDSLIDHKTKYSLTWAAIIIAIILVVPGFMIGGIVALIYKWFLGGVFGIGGDRWVFFIEWIDKIVLLWFPALLHGTVGGVFSIAITGKIFKSANMEVVSYSTSAIIIFIFVAAVIFSFYITDIREDLVLHEDLVSVMLSTAAEIIGIVLGLFYFRVFGR